jgi:hypothetical protein
MPIEIRELHIRMNVTAGPSGQGSADQPAAAGGRGAEAQRAAADDLVTRCVEQVMDLLRNKAER